MAATGPASGSARRFVNSVPEIMEGIKSHTPRSSNVAIENTNGGVHEKIIYENFPLPRLITGWYLLSA